MNQEIFLGPTFEQAWNFSCVARLYTLLNTQQEPEVCDATKMSKKQKFGW